MHVAIAASIGRGRLQVSAAKGLRSYNRLRWILAPDHAVTGTGHGRPQDLTNGAGNSWHDMFRSSRRSDGTVRFLYAVDVLDPELLGHCQLALDGHHGIVSLSPRAKSGAKLGPELRERCMTLLVAITNETRCLYFPGARREVTAWRRTWALALRKLGYTTQSIGDALGYTQIWTSVIVGPGWGFPGAFTRRQANPDDDPEALALGMGRLLDRFGKRKDTPRLLAWRMKISEGSLKRRAAACGRVVRALRELRQ